MNRIIRHSAALASATAFLFSAACGPTPPPAPVPDATMAASSHRDLALLRHGHEVYLAQCGRCHEHVLPDDVTRADWHVVLPGMAWNAGLSKADEGAVMTYLMAAVP